MTREQIAGPVRIVVPALLWALVASGWLTPADVSFVTELVIDAVPPVVTLGAVVWSVWDWAKHRQIARVAAMPEVKRVVTTAAIANVGPLADNPKVAAN
jgi:CHASE2 domain-containing sensor protein